MRLKLARWDIDTGTVIRTVELALQKTVRGCHIKHDNIYSPHVQPSPICNAAMQAPLVVLYEVWHLSHHLVIMVIENDEFIPHSAFQNDIICPKKGILMSRAGASRLRSIGAGRWSIT